jgi:uncharacterized protein (DUF1330 family)
MAARPVSARSAMVRLLSRNPPERVLVYGRRETDVQPQARAPEEARAGSEATKVEQVRRIISMAAYLIADVTTTDQATMDEYRKQVPATITKYGGRFLVRGGAHHVVEGDWKPNRLVVIEFPSLEQARRWYDCEEYRVPKALRLKAGRTNLVMVEGAS